MTSFPEKNSTAVSQARRPLFQVALDLVFPRSCPACHYQIRGGWQESIVCHRCTDQLVPMPATRCQVCGEPFAGNLDAPFRCSNCRERSFAFDFATARYRNTGVARDMVHRLKYQKQRWLRNPLGRMVAAAIRDELRIGGLDNAVLVPVPAHKLRQRERGFNQAHEIAVVAGKLLGIPVVECLIRLLPTSRQTHLGREERLANLEGAFSPKTGPLAPSPARIHGRQAILVDDVLTTGATSHHAALGILQFAQPERIVVATATRA